MEHDPPVADWTPVGATLMHDNPVPSGIVPDGHEMLDTHTCKFEGTTTVPAAHCERHLVCTNEYPDGQSGTDILFWAQMPVNAFRRHQYVFDEMDV